MEHLHAISLLGVGVGWGVKSCTGAWQCMLLQAVACSAITAADVINLLHMKT
jgi:hypothetical protein